MKNTLSHVILSEAKNLCGASSTSWHLEILRGAQNDMSGPVFHGVLLRA